MTDQGSQMNVLEIKIWLMCEMLAPCPAALLWLKWIMCVPATESQKALFPEILDWCRIYALSFPFINSIKLIAYEGGTCIKISKGS